MAKIGYAGVFGGSSMGGRLEENLHSVLSYLAAEALIARKHGKIDRAEKLSVAFKILSKEYDRIMRQKKMKNKEK